MAQTKTTRIPSLAAVVLAAGKGKRLRSARPKVLHPICGEPTLWHVLQLVLVAKPEKIVIVVGHGADEVREAVRSWNLSPAPVFVEQTEQLGTGHAVLAARRAVGRVDDVLVANGDFDPILPGDVRRILQRHRRTGAAATIGSVELADPGEFGRVVRDGRRVLEVVEYVDASPEVRRITEVATNWVAFRRDALFRALPKLDRNNRQHEYYLNRVYPMFAARGERLEAVPCDTGGAFGLNSRRGLADVVRVVRERINAQHMANGVTLADPAATYIDVGVRIGSDTTIAPNVYLEGDTVVGRGCAIGPSVRVVDSSIGDRSTRAVRGRARLDDRPRRRGRAVRADASRRRDARRVEGRRVRRPEGRDGRARLEGAAPVVRRRRRDRRGREHRRRHRSRSTSTATTNIGR